MRPSEKKQSAKTSKQNPSNQTDKIPMQRTLPAAPAQAETHFQTA